MTDNVFTHIDSRNIELQSIPNGERHSMILVAPIATLSEAATKLKLRLTLPSPHPQNRRVEPSVSNYEV